MLRRGMMGGGGGAPSAVGWNPADATAGAIFSLANKKMASTDTSAKSARVTSSKASGKWALSILVSKPSSYVGIGIASGAAALPAFWSTAAGMIWDGGVGGLLHRNGPVGPFAGGVIFDTGDSITVLYDATAGTVGYAKNGSFIGTAFTGVAANGFVAAYVSYPGASLEILDTLPAYATSNGYALWGP